MLSVFRRGLSSWLVLAFFGLVLGALVITGVGTPGSLGDLGSSANGERLANVGSERVGSIDVSQRLQLQLENLRQEQPGLEIGTLVREGAVEQILESLIDLRAFQAFAAKHGVFVSDRMIDAEIAGVDAFKGPTGQFDRARFESLLDQRNTTEAQLRADLARDMVAQMVAGPVAAGARPSAGMVAPYAGLMLELRQGAIATVPSSIAGVGAPPTAKELDTFYQRNATRYTVPERRSVRYAVFDRSRFEGAMVPSDAEIAAYYKKNAALYAGKERRGLTQVIVQDQTAAKTIATASDIQVAAKKAGVEALKLDPMEKSAYTGLSAATVADAVFSVAQGGIAGPVKSGLGWHVVRVDSIATIAGKTVAEARSDISAILEKEKRADAEADFIAKLEDAVSDGETFEAVAKANGLAVIATPLVTAAGKSPDDPGFVGTADLAPVLKEAFQAEPDDDAVVLSIGERHAFLDLDRVVPAAPQPLAKIIPVVTRDFVLDRAARAARAIADAIASKANGGGGFAAAVTATDKRVGAPSSVSARRVDILQSGGKAPPPLALMFSMQAGRAKVLEAPDKQGWFVVWLDKIVPGKADTSPELIAAAQRDLSQSAQAELTKQFLSAIRADLKVTTDRDAVARLKKSYGASVAK